tara:strand:+ start:1017 stop:1319 length:303 start_codon:yes stop_codon:yes gene_type:complete
MFYIMIFVLILLIFSSYFCIKFALFIIRIQDTLEDSLEKLDKKHDRVEEILKIPVFFDSPEIRSLLSEIKETRDIILNISFELNNLSRKNFDQENEKELD